MTLPHDKFANQLDWNLLRTFMVIVQERSITLAAHRLALTQPSVSAALRRLEERLERRLIDRGGATAFHVTAVGEALYRACAEIYGTVSTLPQVLDSTHETVRGVVTLHIASHIDNRPMAALIAAFRQLHGLISFRIRHQPCSEVLGALSRKALTMGLVSQYNEHAVFEFHRLADQPMAYYHAKDSKPTDMSNAPVVDFDDERAGSALEVLNHYRYKTGLGGPVVAEASDCGAVAELIRSGVGLGALPRQFAKNDAGLCELALTQSPPSLPVYLVRHGPMHLSPAEQCFFRYLAEQQCCPPSWAG